MILTSCARFLLFVQSVSSKYWGGRIVGEAPFSSEVLGLVQHRAAQKQVKNEIVTSSRQQKVPVNNKMVILLRGQSFRTEMKSMRISDKGTEEIYLDRWACDRSARH